MARILVIEDEPALCEALRLGLSDEGHVVDVAHDGTEGLFALLEGDHELVLLDRMLPGFSGDDICRRARLDGLVLPILMLTARDRPRDAAEGLDLGADDYVTKPFDFEELLARIRALLRRSAGHSEPCFRLGELTVDPAARRVTRGARDVQLTAKEFQLLEVLARRAGRVQSKAELARAAWESEPDDNVVEVHISHLRRKLGPGLIRTIRGMGYLLEER